MAEISRRERKKQETYERLYSTALYLFQTQGYETTSIEQITQRADVGKGTFYNYFDSKEAVALEFSRRRYQDLILKGRLSQSNTIRERLSSLLEAWADFMVHEREMAWVTIKQRDYAELDKGLHYGIMGVITLGQRGGELSDRFDPCFLAESLEGMALQHFIHWHVTQEGNLKEEMERTISLFFEGLFEHKMKA
ncbi:TetR/AcrR family transcriptional regulator [Desulfitobacterium metallireducens]|uniref:Transcriptional regulator n=1 Tax=Desulfitobacterium metallireducens DSM 15288 TaxID=871968 RepID=W0E7D3_9FIRM|nr:TetR/AcrR family transcriptional regulator [Desulfitobacterium metallireducens]AHF06662.1 transcriptional regulator [Desulfitobacterium metallireducens DSM 15288]